MTGSDAEAHMERLDADPAIFGGQVCVKRTRIQAAPVAGRASRHKAASAFELARPERDLSDCGFKRAGEVK